MEKQKTIIGIDVSKKKLDVTILQNPKDKKHLHFIVNNCKKGITQIFEETKKLQIKNEDLIICFEHTGVYAMPLCFYLHKKKVKYSMIPAIEIHRSKGLTRGKNDKTDSKEIALYGLTHSHKLKFYNLPEDLLLELKLLLSERDKIIKSIGVFTKTKEITDFMPKPIGKQTISLNKQILNHLKKALKKVDDLIQDLIKSNEDINFKYNLAMSVPGVGPQIAVHLISFTRGFTAFDNWRKLACYSGIAPFEYSSGSSIRGRTKVSPLANKKLKYLFHMGAISACHHDPQLRKYYLRKVNEGKNKMSVLNAVRCKIASRICAVIKRGTPYVRMEAFS